MWLLPVFPFISRVVARVYYRITYVGGRVPASSPALLVANHPNSLFDPVLVVAASRRRVRFLAKSPLFSDRLVGWLVRAAGAIPVYRKVDDPSQVSRNEETFRAVHEALAEGAAVGIFPEGTSHSEPELVPLKTGAARIALGFAADHGRAVFIVPVGLVFRAKDTFRSRAHVLVGEPVRWRDLAGRPPADAEAVTELTARIEAAMRSVTVNLEAWADGPLVECALDLWETVQPTTPDPDRRVQRIERTTGLLRALRSSGDERHAELVAAIRSHAARLNRLGLEPSDLSRDTAAGPALRWSLKRLLWVSPPALLIGLAGYVLFWPPFRLTAWIAAAFRPALDKVSTYKLLVGIPVYLLWITVLALGVAVRFGAAAGVMVAAAAPALGMAGLRVRERWRGAWEDVRGFLFLRSRRALIAVLRTRQDTLARALDRVYRHPPAPAKPAAQPES